MPSGTFGTMAVQSSSQTGMLWPALSSWRWDYMSIEQASKKWTIPIRDWKGALNRFMIEFEGRLEAYV